MRDIVERLRDSNTTRRIGESYADVHDRRQADRNESADTITRLTARVEELEAALRDLVRLVDEDQEEDAPPYLVDQVLDRARAVITKGESND